MIYERHSEWAETNRDMSSKFRQFAVDAGLNGSAFDDCMSSARFAGRIQASFLEGQQLGVPSTPSFVIGNKLYPGAQSSDSIRAWVQALISASPAPAPPAKP
jgi:protein-disulfide isomerase